MSTNAKSEAFIDKLATTGNYNLSTLSDFLFDISNENRYYQNVYFKNIYFKDTHLNYQEVRPADYFTEENMNYLMLKADGNEKGFVGSFRYKVYDFDDKIVTCFVDVSKDMYFLRYFETYSILGFIVCEIIVFFLLLLFSRKVINPLVENIENQRNFIDNASHELKTPISVLAANNEIHEMKYGENKWTKSNKRQIDRMNKLVNQMLKLSRYEEETKPMLVYEKVDMIKLINLALNNMEPIIINKKLHIDKNLSQLDIYADKSMMKDLVEIIIENAVKYTPEDGKIILNITSSTIEILNNSSPMTKSETEKIFEKFYRTDKARSRETGGNGIGLSIAKSICKMNNMKISASYNNGFFKIKVSKTS